METKLTLKNLSWIKSRKREPSHTYQRSEEHTSELQSRGHLVCRLLLEKKNTTLQMIIRDFDKDQFAKRKNYVKRIVKDLETTYGEGSIDQKLMDPYYNMQEKIEHVKVI